jgi:hypothetical protein
MAHADLAGKADQQIEPEHDHRVNPHADDQVEIEAVREQKRQHRDDGGDHV